MGVDKATLVVDGVPMARRVADALLAAGARGVVAVGGDQPALAAMGLACFPDRHVGAGPLAAVIRALEAPGHHDAVAVLACDLVDPEPAVLRDLAAARRRHDADVAVPVVGGREQWVSAVWHRRVAGLLADVFAAGERSLHGATTGLRTTFVAVDDPAALRDADHPSDLPPGAGR